MSPRITIKSVTCFLHCSDEYLFIHRTKRDSASDGGRLNGIGGKLEPGEDYLTAAIRETKEETGLTITPQQLQLKAIVNMTSGYPEDWVICFFAITVPTKEIPRGLENDEGQLIWLPKGKVLNSEYQLVDDINYCWDHISGDEKRTLFVGCSVSEKLEISSWQSRLL